MSKYEPLGEYLGSCEGPVVVARFDQLERILGFSLPDSARRHAAWWANQAGPGHVQAAAWQGAGWATRNLDLGGESVEFERRTDYSRREPIKADRLFDQARRFTGIDDQDVLVVVALGALVEREAARRLAQRGGTMPDLELPPRTRPEI